MQNQATSNAKKFAKSLRKDMTDAERLLWQKLRLEQLGVKFRRQHPLGSYIADFACLAPALIVEIDGSQHSDRRAYDEKRDAFFKAQGFDVIRFAANLPFSDLQSIVQAIYNRVIELTSLAPIPAFPQRGKEQEESAFLPPLLGEESVLLLPPLEKKSVLLLPPPGEGRDGGSSRIQI